jgi:hypothetical protein
LSLYLKFNGQQSIAVLLIPFQYRLERAVYLILSLKLAQKRFHPVPARPVLAIQSQSGPSRSGIHPRKVPPKLRDQRTYQFELEEKHQ